jgi:hypothetical protein
MITSDKPLITFIALCLLLSTMDSRVSIYCVYRSIGRYFNDLSMTFKSVVVELRLSDNHLRENILPYHSLKIRPVFWLEAFHNTEIFGVKWVISKLYSLAFLEESGQRQ